MEEEADVKVDENAAVAVNESKEENIKEAAPEANESKEENIKEEAAPESIPKAPILSNDNTSSDFVSSSGFTSQEGETLPKKKRRRPGWDVPPPAAAPALIVPFPTLGLTMPGTVPAFTLSSPSSDTAIQPQSLLQQLLAQQALAKTATPVVQSKPGSRVYVG